jgi:hypothetical protein
MARSPRQERLFGQLRKHQLNMVDSTDEVLHKRSDLMLILEVH